MNRNLARSPLATLVCGLLIATGCGPSPLPPAGVITTERITVRGFESLTLGNIDEATGTIERSSNNESEGDKKNKKDDETNAADQIHIVVPPLDRNREQIAATREIHFAREFDVQVDYVVPTGLPRPNENWINAELILYNDGHPLSISRTHHPEFGNGVVIYSPARAGERQIYRFVPTPSTAGTFRITRFRQDENQDDSVLLWHRINERPPLTLGNQLSDFFERLIPNGPDVPAAPVDSFTTEFPAFDLVGLADSDYKLLASINSAGRAYDRLTLAVGVAAPTTEPFTVDFENLRLDATTILSEMKRASPPPPSESVDRWIVTLTAVCVLLPLLFFVCRP